SACGDRSLDDLEDGELLLAQARPAPGLRPAARAVRHDRVDPVAGSVHVAPLPARPAATAGALSVAGGVMSPAIETVSGNGPPGKHLYESVARHPPRMAWGT